MPRCVFLIRLYRIQSRPVRRKERFGSIDSTMSMLVLYVVDVGRRPGIFVPSSAYVTYVVTSLLRCYPTGLSLKSLVYIMKDHVVLCHRPCSVLKFWQDVHLSQCPGSNVIFGRTLSGILCMFCPRRCDVMVLTLYSVYKKRNVPVWNKRVGHYARIVG